MTTFNHVHPGQPLGISAEAHNAMLDAARAHRQAGTLAGREAARAVADRGVIWVRNNTGAALDQFGVVAIGLPIITADANENEFKQRVTFEGGTPAASDTGQFAVVIEAIPAGTKVVKFAAPIGSATCPIQPGEHVHLHNLKSDYLPTYTLDDGKTYVRSAAEADDHPQPVSE